MWCVAFGNWFCPVLSLGSAAMRSHYKPIGKDVCPASAEVRAEGPGRLLTGACIKTHQFCVGSAGLSFRDPLYHFDSQAGFKLTNASGLKKADSKPFFTILV